MVKTLRQRGVNTLRSYIKSGGKGTNRNRGFLSHSPVFQSMTDPGLIYKFTLAYKITTGTFLPKPGHALSARPDACAN